MARKHDGTTILFCLSYGAGIPSKLLSFCKASFPLFVLCGTIPLTVLQKIFPGALKWIAPLFGLIAHRLRKNSKYLTKLFIFQSLVFSISFIAYFFSFFFIYVCFCRNFQRCWYSRFCKQQPFDLVIKSWQQWQLIYPKDDLGHR